MKPTRNTDVTAWVREVLKVIGLATLLALIILLIRRILDRLGI